ncbi:chemotaxis response regulator protein-glutamate methylesterase [bacterium BMS3Bbin14]|nr:chemotaxis response regulator protein-glutamate methylesterase [bacterium BMS3Bbin14]HDK43628.1 chemotaxis response regulator protein-glutamate methylesterase [Desulfobacteraceae bacterium]HDL98400.1 chemotaxis response regulator protein-glutamate methylesterase [Desulfobacteraceae bacterium]HDO30237.1 chemotaxis response regulator protein-glutamate methylesterase [Desulfobacteraceae bacterium]
MKIGIVNDMPMAMEALRRTMISGGHQILWVAENGAIAVERCAQEKPDLVLMDLIMPVMDGVEATRRIMKESPCQILVVTASVASNSGKVFEAMGAGALDVVATPVLGTENGTSGQDLLTKIERIGILSGMTKRTSPQRPVRPLQPGVAPREKGQDLLLVIGCSTGGPRALLRILSTFPRDFPASIVVAQHMDEQFISGLVDWLNNQVALEVKVLSKGDRPRPGVVLIPATSHHLVMHRNNTLGYSVEPTDNYYHPSVDVFFKSVARYWQGGCIGVILTGMGRDGADGLLALRRQGNYSIAQDQESSVVFGMPKAAIEVGAAQDILPVEDIGSKIIDKLGEIS